MLSTLALHSLWSRRLSVSLTICGIALSVMMIIGVERVRIETRENFTNTISGTDMLVGARTSPTQLLLYSVFHIGDATNSIKWSSFEKIARHPSVRWVIPLSLGDSHRGYRVVGTTNAYFDNLRFGRQQSLEFASGDMFRNVFDAVIGAEVAASLDYQLGDSIVIAHGTRDDGLSGHAELPFSVTGILQPTGTPADRSVHVTLEAVEAIHVGWESGTRIDAQTLRPEEAAAASLQPDEITAFLLALQQQSQVLTFQRAINGFPDEPLLAVLPGVALTSLWSLFTTAEYALIAVAAMTVVTGLLGMVVGIFSTLNERRREMAVMRSVGARPFDISRLLVAEAAFIGIAGALGGYLLLCGAIAIANPLAGARFGIQLSLGLPSPREWLLLATVATAACATGGLPAWRAYRMSLHDGLNAGS